ncbi:glycoside hydrolase [Piromyces finnis]|nr:glycoside hydrolase [Piromyces finnis]|eukprot:ORX44857.1 glycoside hydrolase [Piromyces finnis]
MIINQNITTTGECWSEKFGIPCCKEALMPLRTTYDGGWSQENGEWCGLGESLRPIDDIPPPATPVYKLKDMVDPAADCDISDVIHGDSLGQEAPFRFGVGLYGNDLAMSTITSEKMRKVIKYQFNSMTYTNLMNPSAILDQQASIDNIMNGNEDPILNFSNIVDGLDFAYKNGLNIRGHALVWHTQVPEWFFRDGYYSNTEFVSRDVMEYRLDSYIRKFLGFVQFNYPGTVDVWDVVNEAIEITDGQYDETTGWYTRTANNKTPNPWYEIFGPDYVAIAFRIARKYALPNVKLIYNDHNTFQIQPHDKTQAIIDLANILQQENLIDGIGMQSYIGVTWPNLDDYFNGLERLITSTGLEIQITELTITPPIGDNWLGAQAEQYYEYFNRLLSYIKNGYNISSVTVYGLQDGYRFYTKDSTKTRLLDHDLKKKPNFNAIINVLKNYNEAVASDNIIEISEIKEEEENKKIKEKEKEKEKIIDNDDEEKGEKEVKK